MTESNQPEAKATILVVDDTAANLSLMSGLLKELYHVKVAISGGRGLEIAQSDSPPDLILLDIMMPELDGYEVCQQLKKNPLTRDIPIIFLTAKSEIDDEQRGLELGAVDYITKPFSPPIVLARIRIHLALKASLDFLREQNKHLEIESRKRAEHIMGMITGVVLHESDSDKLAEVILTLGGFLEKNNSEAIDYFYENEDILHATFPKQFKAFELAIAESKFVEAYDMLTEIASEWKIIC